MYRSKPKLTPDIYILRTGEIRIELAWIGQYSETTKNRSSRKVMVVHSDCRPMKKDVFSRLLGFNVAGVFKKDPKNVN